MVRNLAKSSANNVDDELIQPDCRLLVENISPSAAMFEPST